MAARSLATFGWVPTPATERRVRIKRVPAGISRAKPLASWTEGLSRRSGQDLALDPLPKRILGEIQVIFSLQIYPHFRRGAEIPR